MYTACHIAMSCGANSWTPVSETARHCQYLLHDRGFGQSYTCTENAAQQNRTYASIETHSQLRRTACHQQGSPFVQANVVTPQGKNTKRHYFQPLVYWSVPQNNEFYSLLFVCKCLSAWLSACLMVWLHACLPVVLLVCMLVCLSACLPACLHA